VVNQRELKVESEMKFAKGTEFDFNVFEVEKPVVLLFEFQGNKKM
jgi:hypothetical protein